jgi:hypothetical protein
MVDKAVRCRKRQRGATHIPRRRAKPAGRGPRVMAAGGLRWGRRQHGGGEGWRMAVVPQARVQWLGGDEAQGKKLVVQ